MRYLLSILAAVGTLAAVGATAEPRPALARFFAGHEGAFVLYDVQNGTYTRSNAARCRQRFRPQSTRKIPEGLIGLETGVIPDADHTLSWDKTRHAIPAHNRDHSLRTAFDASTNWYFERVVAQVGPERVRQHLQAFRYGNQQIGGNAAPYGEDALRISPDEQVAFLLRLYRNELPLSGRTMKTMRDVMLRRKTKKGILRGKTGTGGHPKDGKPRRPDSEMVATLGWFVGWVEHAGKGYVFATNITGGKNPTGQKARQITERILESRGLL